MYILLLVVPVLMFSTEVKGAEDYRTLFEKHLDKLTRYCSGEAGTAYKGKFSFERGVDFSSAHSETAYLIFPELLEGASEYYSFFIRLENDRKKVLLRYFSEFELFFEEELRKAGLPEEIKYLPPALSAMYPKASDESGRVGMWQLRHFQAVLNGAHINRLSDERLNPRFSTVAAVNQLKNNVETFESPELAVLAFIAGNTTIRNAIAGLTSPIDYKALFASLPEYVGEEIKAYQAMRVFLNKNRSLQEKESLTPKEIPDTVLVHQTLHLQQITKVLGISSGILERLNPQYRYGIVEGLAHTNKLTIPAGSRDDFVIWEDSIYKACDSTAFEIVQHTIEYPPEPTRKYVQEQVKDLEIAGKTKVEYTLQRGDVLGVIAERYKVRVSDLKYWNNIYNERKIQAGKKIKIYVDKNQATEFVSVKKEMEENKDSEDIVARINGNSPLKEYEKKDYSNKIEHVVKKGESPYLIAKQYSGITPEQILQWNHIDDARKIQIGQKLILYLNR